jgi:hypothetical protein
MDNRAYVWLMYACIVSTLVLRCLFLYCTYVDIYTYWLAHPVHTHALVLRLNSVDRSTITSVGLMLRRRRSYRKKRSSAEAVCIKWPKVPLREASVLQTDLKIE